MPKSFPLLSVLFALGCGSPQPPKMPAPVASAPSTSTRAETPPVMQYDLKVYTRYQDFSGHGYTASGRWYRRENGAYLSAQCHISHVADPQAGPPDGPTCGAWTPVPKEQWEILESARRGRDEVNCAEMSDICKSLGLAAQPMSAPTF